VLDDHQLPKRTGNRIWKPLVHLCVNLSR
jgi:hypothetical protein